MTLPGKDSAEASVTRLLWREQVRELPRAAWHELRRLVRREPRWYLVVDDRVVARLVSNEDYEALLNWIEYVHGQTFRAGITFGRGTLNAPHGHHAPDVGDTGTA